MEAGKYRRRVSLVNHIQGFNSYGVPYTTPVTHINCWAWRDKIGSQANYAQKADSFASSYRYEIYYNSGVVIDTNMILTDGGEEFKIVGIEITGDKKVKWQLVCNRKART